MLPGGINDHILVPNLSYLDVYQYEANNNISKKISILFLGWNQNQKTDKTVVHVYPSTLAILKIYRPLQF